jgi:high affinity Mn2+ porin
LTRLCLLALSISALAYAQIPLGTTPDSPPPNETWNWFYQATSIGDYHGAFRAPYTGPFSLQPTAERDVSLTTTLFFGFRPFANTQIYFDPEIAGGRGFSGVNGVANAPNGELPRVASATPKPYIARVYLTQDFGFGSQRETIESDANQLGGTRPMTRYSITIGRFTVSDFFDNNAFTHDPRTQFLGWGVMYNGAWDYPADTRGYTWGWVHEFHTRRYSFRYGSAAEPRVANGLRFDRRLFRDRGDMFEAERRWSPHARDGAVRLLSYFNHTNSGSYAEALAISRQTGQRPDVAAASQTGRLKYGFGISADQQLTPDLGIFGRLGWNDGKTESFAFTSIDRLSTLGVSLKGPRWHRPHDVAASEITISGLSAVHAQYLAAGGYDFLIGDGRLRYGTENIWESYYSAQLLHGFTATYDLQFIVNPAYNQDRGPVWVHSLRLHLEFGKPDFR